LASCSLVLGIALAALMLSYTPDDPNWMAATDTAPQNLLGRTGASVAAILMMIVGYGALVLPIASHRLGCTRLVLHAGTDRAFPRVFFLPIVLALASIYSASHVPPLDWTHSFGLGGLFGDTVLGAVLNALPISARWASRLSRRLRFWAVPRCFCMWRASAGRSFGPRCGSWSSALSPRAGC
jgi:S-DNA-T family DNA segregation ATPase FtsK/SpoIIIE